MNEYQVPADTLCSQVQGGQTVNDQRQELNNALAQLAAAGNTVALGQLWEINKPILHRMFWQWYNRNQSIAEAAGITMEDFEQEGYFAIKEAAEYHNPLQGSFLTALRFMVLKRIRQNTCSGAGTYITTADGRRVRVSADSLNMATSLDASVDAEDDGGTTLGDLQADPAAEAEIRDIEEKLYHEQLHNLMEEALQRLSPEELVVVRCHFYQGKSYKETAEAIGKEVTEVNTIASRAIRHLRNDSILRQWHDDFVSTHAWHNTGYFAWKHGGSVEERMVEALELRNLL